MLFNCHSHFSSLQNVSIINESDSKVEESDFYSVGIHPWQSAQYEDNFLLIREKAKNKKCLAIGEIGLDKLKGPVISIQLKSFEEQIKLSEEIGLPVILHCVKAWNEIQEVKKKLQPKQPWIYHGFNKVGILESVLNSEVIVSLGASILSNELLQSSVKKIPNDQLLIETDDASIDIL